MTHQTIKQAFDYFYASNNLTYDARYHRYKLDGITCAGVSTVSDYEPKDFLKHWAAKMVVEHLADKQELIKTLTPKEYADLLLEAKKMHKAKSDEALEIGTAAHDWCEQHIHGKQSEITEAIKNPVEQFLDFEHKHKIQWVCTEKIVCHRGELVAGRLDSLAFVDGALSLVDLKTSSQISSSYYLQTAGYAMCLEDMGIKVDRRIILRLPKIKDEKFEACEVDTPLKEDIQAFIGRRRSYAWQNMVDCKYSDEVEKYYGKTKIKIKKLRLKLI